MLCGPAASLRVKAMLLRAMPTKEKEVTTLVCISELKAQCSDAGFKFLPSSLQNVWKDAITKVTAVQSSSTKQVKLDKVNSITTDMWRHCRFFLRYEGSIDGKAEPAKHTSTEAIQALLVRVAKKVKAGDPNDISSEIALLTQFEFICEGELAAQVKGVLAVRTGAQAKAKAAPAKGKGVKKLQDGAIEGACV